MSALASWARKGAAVAALVVAAVVVGEILADGSPAAQRWTFMDPKAEPSDHGLRPLAAHGGAWTVEAHEQATGARALVNREGADDAPPAMVLAATLWLRDFKAVTRCKTAKERSAQQCGVVFRLRDEARYSVARMDSVGGRVVLADVASGNERVVAEARADAASEVWHELRVEAQAGVIRVSLDSRQLIEAVEHIPALAGRVGLWVPSAGVAYFDELAVDELSDWPRSLEVLPFLARSRS